MKRIYALAALVLFAFLAGHILMVAGDDGTYIALARSIRAGEYRAINVPGSPIQTQYPPLYPLLLAPLANLPPASVGVLRLWTAIWALLAVSVLLRAANRRDPALGMLGVVPVIVSPLYGEFGTAVLTESIFLLIAYATLTRAAAQEDRFAAADTARGQETTSADSEPVEGRPSASAGREGKTVALDPLLPLSLAAACLLKSAGVALVVAVLFHQAYHRRGRALAVTCLIVGFALAPWWAWQFVHGSNYVQGHILQRDIYDPSAGMLTPLGIFLERIPHNLSRYVGRVVVDVLLPPFFRGIAPWTPLFPLKIAASFLLTVAVVRGFIRRWKSAAWGAEELYVIASGGLFLMHPVFADRYLFLILPSLAGYLLLAIPDTERRRRVAVAWGAALVVGCTIALAEPPARADVAYMQAVDWLKEHAASDAVILARKPTAVWFYTGRQAAGYPATLNPAAWPSADYIIRDDYVIGVHAARRYVDPVVSDSAVFTLRWSSAILPDVKIYERRH